MGFLFARFIIRLFVRLFAVVEVVGVENIPTSGPFIGVSNHLGRMDVPLAFLYTDRTDVTMIAAEKYRKYAIWRWFVRRLNAIWIDRYNADFEATRAALNRLKAGGILVVAPEGTRSRTGGLIKARSGVAYLAAKSGAPVLPLGISGTEDKVVVANLKRLHRPRIHVKMGKPFNLPPLPQKDKEAALEQYTDEIMCHIAALLPERNRGVYADHSRTLELINENKAMDNA